MSRIRTALAWATSRQGIHDIAAAAAAIVAIVKALQEAGVL